jgi:hypothetical protein
MNTLQLYPFTLMGRVAGADFMEGRCGFPLDCSGKCVFVPLSANLYFAAAWSAKACRTRNVQNCEGWMHRRVQFRTFFL